MKKKKCYSPYLVAYYS